MNRIKSIKIVSASAGATMLTVANNAPAREFIGNMI